MGWSEGACPGFSKHDGAGQGLRGPNLRISGPHPVIPEQRSRSEHPVAGGACAWRAICTKQDGLFLSRRHRCEGVCHASHVGRKLGDLSSEGLDGPQTRVVERDEDLLLALDWCPLISDTEIFEAKLNWLAARDADEPSAVQVSARFNYYTALIGLQAQQIAREFRVSNGCL